MAGTKRNPTCCLKTRAKPFKWNSVETQCLMDGSLIPIQLGSPLRTGKHEI